MLKSLKLKFEKLASAGPIVQIFLVSVAGLLAIALRSLLHFTPTIRFNTESLFRGAIGGLVLGVAYLLLQWVLVRKITNQQERGSGHQKGVATAICAASAEELILRGYLFAFLAVRVPIIAFILNGAASYLVGIRGIRERKDYLIVPLLRCLQGTALALMYSWNRSLFLVAVARLVADLVIEFGEAEGVKRGIDREVQRRALPLTRIFSSTRKKRNSTHVRSN